MNILTKIKNWFRKQNKSDIALRILNDLNDLNVECKIELELNTGGFQFIFNTYTVLIREVQSGNPFDCDCKVISVSVVGYNGHWFSETESNAIFDAGLDRINVTKHFTKAVQPTETETDTDKLRKLFNLNNNGANK